jgi:hypothetical protein
MPSIWIIVAVAVGALNLRLIVPALAAFFGIVWQPVPAERAHRLPG